MVLEKRGNKKVWKERFTREIDKSIPSTQRMNTIHPNASTERKRSNGVGLLGKLKAFVFPKGESNPEATRGEIFGWYLYEAANAAFFMGTQDFISIFTVSQAERYAKRSFCLEQYSNMSSASFQGCYETGWAQAYETDGTCVGVATAWSTNHSCVENGGEWKANWRVEAGTVPLFGLKVGHSATYTTAVTVSIILQLLMFLFFGSVADFGSLRKTLFLAMNVVSGVCICLLFLGDEIQDYEYNLSLVVVVQTCLNFAQILFNAWLPLLAATSPESLRLLRESGHTNDEQVKFKIRNNVSAKLAGVGTAYNFGAAILFLLIAVVLLLALSDSIGEEYVVRIIALICGVWLLVLSTISYGLLQPRPGPPLPPKENYLTIGIKQITGTFAKYKELPNLFWYLLAYFIYSDGVSTITGAAAVFGSLELNMSFTEVIYAWFLVSFFSMVSAIGFVYVQRRFDWNKKHILMVNLAIVGLLPLYAIFALRTKTEFYVMVVVFSLQFGSILTFTRSLFSSLIPRGHEAEFFSLYQLTDKGTAWAGPLLLSIVSSKTGSFRAAFSTLVVFFYLGILVLWRFNSRDACREKAHYEAKISNISSFRAPTSAVLSIT